VILFTWPGEDAEIKEEEKEERGRQEKKGKGSCAPAKFL